MKEYGLGDVLLEAVVISVGFKNGVIFGKNYSHAINCHKVMAKSLRRLLLKNICYFLKIFKGLPSDLLQAVDHINHIINERTSENLHAAMQNEALANFLEDYSSFRQQVRGGSQSKTDQFWLTYINRVLLFLS